MQKIKREALKEGMCFSAPVFFDDGVNMFLAEKNPLSMMPPNRLKSSKNWKSLKKIALRLFLF